MITYRNAGAVSRYTAWAIDADGNKTEYTGLTKGRALWRYHWFRRLHYSLRLKQFGWRIED
jgi:hypothetical protein